MLSCVTLSDPLSRIDVLSGYYLYIKRVCEKRIENEAHLRQTVGSGLEDDEEHTDGHGDLLELEAIGEPGAPDDAADVGERGVGDLPEAVAQRFELGRAEREPREQGLGQPGLTGLLQVLAVRLEDVGLPRLEQTRQGVDGVGPLLGHQRLQHAAAHARCQGKHGRSVSKYTCRSFYEPVVSN